MSNYRRRTVPPAPAASKTSSATDRSLVGPTRTEASGSPAGAHPYHRQEPPNRSAERGRP
jgi:hypothetical protein